MILSQAQRRAELCFALMPLLFMLFMPAMHNLCSVLQALLRSFTRHGEMRMHLHIASSCFARASSVDVHKPAHRCLRLFKKNMLLTYRQIVAQACFSGRRTDASGCTVRDSVCSTAFVFFWWSFFGYILNM